MPIHYQIGLIYERLSQPGKAGEFYTKILGQEKDVPSDAPPSLKAILEMAKWRRDHLDWQIKAEQANQTFRHLLSGTNRLSAASVKPLAQNQVSAAAGTGTEPAPKSEPAAMPQAVAPSNP